MRRPVLGIFAVAVVVGHRLLSLGRASMNSSIESKPWTTGGSMGLRPWFLEHACDGVESVDASPVLVGIPEDARSSVAALLIGGVLTSQSSFWISPTIVLSSAGLSSETGRFGSCGMGVPFSGGASKN